MDLLGDTSSGSPQSVTTILQKIQQDMAMTNARQLIHKLSQNCFEKCVPSPATSLSSKENTCLTTCMEKYMATWNKVSQAYVQNAQKASPGGSDSGLSM